MAKENKKLDLASSAIQSLFENGKTELSMQFLRWKLWMKWEAFVGTTIATVTEPVSFQKGVLYVWVRNSTWLHQLQFAKDTMRNKINKELGIRYLRDIRFTLNKQDVPRDPDEVESLKDAIDHIAVKDK